jgi:CRISPR system Cascade subunit CasD
MTSPHTLLLRLVGPMQAWGYRSRFEDRDTSLEPTRSGVLGLLASAAGIARGDADALARLDAALRFGVRVEVPARARGRAQTSSATGFRVDSDFHTAQDVFRASGSARDARTPFSRGATSWRTPATRWDWSRMMWAC